MSNRLSAPRILAAWLSARKWCFLLLALCVGSIFLVYGLYGYEWDIPRYTSLLCLALCGVFAAADLVRFFSRCRMLEKLAGSFPTGQLPPAASLPQRQLAEVIAALDAERMRLVNEAELRDLRDREYYALWVHQIKIPISGLRLLLQQRREEIPPEQRAALEAELYRVEQYVGMVLQYQRLASMNADLQFEQHHKDRLVKQAVKNLAPMFILKNLRLEVGDLPGSVVTDEKWLVFVLEQILTNALKYTKTGYVRVYSETPDTLTVADTGTGIPPEELPRIFERGFTGSAGRSDNRATGLGLYLCREILGRLGFGIEVDSAPGEGTRVTLLLHQRRYETD